MAYRAAVTARLFRALSEIVSSVDPSLPGVDVTDANARADVDRYLSVGGDTAAESAIASATVKGFLYLVHEMTELRSLLPILNGPAQVGGAKPAISVVGRGDPWAKTMRLVRNQDASGVSPVKRADAEARGVEARIERILARVLLGETVSIEGLVWSISTSSDPSIAPQVRQATDDDVRCRTAAAIGCGPGSEAEIAHACAVRQRLFALELAHVQSFDLSRLAYVIWEGRDCLHGRDISDWLGAERALATARA